MLAEQFRRDGFAVPHQEELIELGRNTLVKLAECIRTESDIVLRIIGPSVGAIPNPDYLAALFEHRDPSRLAAKFPKLFGADEKYKRVTYTQWEAWLGIFYGKRVLLCVDEKMSPPALVTGPAPISVNEHLQLLNEFAGYQIKFATVEVLLSTARGALHRLANQGSFEPHAKANNLPFVTLGTLFKGRDSFIEHFRQNLQNDSNRPQVIIARQAVHGEGGVGKTRLAVEYALQHADAYTALLFVSASTPVQLRTDLAALIGPMVLNLPDAPTGDFDATLARVLHWLDAHPGWFLIIDNVDSEESAIAVEELLHELRSGHVVITSRIRNWSEGVEPLELDVLSEDASTDFLLEATKNGRSITPTDAHDARLLAQDVDGLALALEQSAAYIRTVQTSIAAYRTRWAQFDATVRGWHDARLMKYPKSVAVTWESTFVQLPASAVAVLRLCAMFGPAPIPIGLLAAAFPNLDADLVPLLKFSLVKKSPSSETVRVHRLIQKIVNGRLPRVGKLFGYAAAGLHFDVRRSNFICSNDSC